MLTPKPSILIVEDEVLIANDIRSHLLKLDYNISGIAYSSNKALDLMHSRPFDLAVLDINIGGSRTGIEIAEIINEKYHKPFIYLTSYSDKDTLARAQKTLPYGYIVKPFDERDLAATISMALYKFSQESDNEISKEKINNAYKINISDREFELINHFIQGKSIQETANDFFLSENTIKTHLRRIYDKLDVHNRVDFTKKILEA